ncbi:RNA polymerase, sigma-24 subunit, ECF subfamily [Chloroherpeton thalassium ATCC 35110]|uniref:RNA polymerase, sigma-24 subunit, ECF subfamily n=1 Tax=Chloroherpeton thalassium (strain ATCC 35110 / GB-78) TaxID=517418 RepID=B3QYW7_CHLT3|nr:sigma-70 family RNA polymerase sigma factor [Chloroherpeton thalassium]ACF13660.1 RNA polymerase, sigma-24 subunit, ECF subfamily [Chloroherpeton thalassium ATCC 35110]
MPKKKSLSQGSEEDPNSLAKSVSDASSGKENPNLDKDSTKGQAFGEKQQDESSELSEEDEVDFDDDDETSTEDDTPYTPDNDEDDEDENDDAGEENAEGNDGDDAKEQSERKHSRGTAEKSRSRLEDYALIDQICDGDPHKRDQAYKRLLNKYRGQIFNLILKIIHNQNEVEDLVQETFSKAFNSIENFNKEYAFSTWLYRIATNSSIDYLRKRRLKTYSLDNPITTKDDEYTIEIPDSSEEPGKNIMQSQRDALVRSAIKNLPPKYRKVIEMRHLQERTYEEIAADLDIPLGTVKAHIFRAREMLYKMLRDKLRNY